jgi:tRNA (guanine37-N1)-methyltransferase
MQIDVITIFPEVFAPFLRTSLIGRAVEEGLINVGLHDLREYTDDPHRSVDDEPFGGGGGMVMLAQPWLSAVRALSGDREPRRLLLSPQGTPLNDAKVRELANESHLMLCCGRYEGVDERVIEAVIDEEISIGDYVMAGGEVPAMVLIEAVSRYVPGVVGLPESVENESFREGLLDYPHYTRPRVIEGMAVPEVLLSGNHRAIEEWRRQEALRATRRKRPDLLDRDAGPREGRSLASLASKKDNTGP